MRAAGVTAPVVGSRRSAASSSGYLSPRKKSSLGGPRARARLDVVMKQNFSDPVGKRIPALQHIAITLLCSLLTVNFILSFK
jgi:hypothetical protein